MLLIRSPRMRAPERQYIYWVILEQFLGLSYKVVYEHRNDIEISLVGSYSGRLLITDALLQIDGRLWLQPESMPKQPLDRMEDKEFGRVPILYGKRPNRNGYIEKYSAGITCGIDLFGSAFFMLTRYEECIGRERDARDRFPSTSSLAFKEHFLHRPIINEYVEIFWNLLVQLWPRLQRLPRQGQSLISHDVDWPFYAYGKSKARMAKEAIADAIKRRNFQSAFKKGAAIWRTRNGNYSGDPFNTFHWLMKQSEEAGLRSAFYFITEETVPGIDGNYSIDNPEIQRVLREIHDRGHEIGLHPSYDTYLNPERIKFQYEKLLEVAESNRIVQQQWGGRQHYLRWKAPDTWQHWEDAGLQYDSTLSYADAPGFRCGVCYEYSVFNLRTRTALKLKERPLIIMEQTVMQMNLHRDETLHRIKTLQAQCKRFEGNFTLLWHNSELVRKEQQSIYQECLYL